MAGDRDGNEPRPRRPWLRALLRSDIRELPVDLRAAVLLVMVTDLVIILPGISDTAARIVLGLPFLLFIPGYAFTAALFPRRGERPTGEADSMASRGSIDGIERIALSIGLSIAIIPFIGLILNFTPWGVRLVPIVISVTGFTLVSVAMAHARRQRLPVDDRFKVPFRKWYTSARSEFFTLDSRTDVALNLLLVAGVVVAAVSVGYALTVPKQGERFTEFYLLSENANGELVAADYPHEFVLGEPRTVVIGVSNQEQESATYSIIVLLQDVRVSDDETVVSQQAELGRFTAEVDDNQTRRWRYPVTPTMAGEQMRLLFLLYRADQVPPEPSTATAYRELHLWVNVSPAD